MGQRARFFTYLPTDNAVILYKLTGHFSITGLAVGPGGGYICFLAMENDMVSRIGVLQPERDSVTMWDIPGAGEIDAVGLISTEDALWFCDRSGSTVYRFALKSGAFTWWAMGGDDGPLYIVPGNPGEFWVSFEDSDKIARLELSY
jgi:streptogramin lyase